MIKQTLLTVRIEKSIGLNWLKHMNSLTHCIMVDSSVVICWTSLFVILASILSLLLYFCWEILFANKVNPDQTPHYVASNRGLHCLIYHFTGFQVRIG